MEIRNINVGILNLKHPLGKIIVPESTFITVGDFRKFIVIHIHEIEVEFYVLAIL